MTQLPNAQSLPSSRRSGAWIDIHYPPLDGGAGFRALRSWLRQFGFRVIDYGGHALCATVWHQRGRHKALVAFLPDHRSIWLARHQQADRLAEVLEVLR